jgi:hypothetical protein
VPAVSTCVAALVDFFAHLCNPAQPVRRSGLYTNEVLSGGNDTRGINSDHEDKLRDQLAALDSAKDIADMDLPGWRLHPLK